MGKDPNDKTGCPYGADLCPKLIFYSEKLDRIEESQRKIEKLTVAIIAIIFGFGAIGVAL